MVIYPIFRGTATGIGRLRRLTCAPAPSRGIC